MLVFDQLEIEADRPLKVTDPVVAVKLLPEIVIDAPGSPLVGFKLDITAATVNVVGLVAETPPGSVTTTLPVVAPVGTTTTTCDAAQLVILVA